MLRASVKLFISSKSGGYGFLETLDLPENVFFHMSYGRKYDQETGQFTDEVETRLPKAGDHLYYEKGPGLERGQVQAVKWAFVE